MTVLLPIGQTHNAVDILANPWGTWDHNNPDLPLLPKAAWARLCHVPAGEQPGILDCVGETPNDGIPENIGVPEAEIYGSFSYAPAGTLLIHPYCDFTWRDADVPVSAAVQFRLDWGIPIYNDEDFCRVHYAFGATGSQHNDYHVPLDTVALGCAAPCVEAYAAYIEADVRDEFGPGRWSDALFNLGSFVTGGTQVFWGSLYDPAHSDFYVSVTDAETYKIRDAEGDTLLRDATGTTIPVTDSTPVALGDVTVVRTPDPPAGPSAKLWTAESTLDRKISVTLTDTPAARIGSVHSYVV